MDPYLAIIVPSIKDTSMVRKIKRKCLDKVQHLVVILLNYFFLLFIESPILVETPNSFVIMSSENFVLAIMAT